MAQPIDVSVPHKLGREEAKRRIAANMGSLQRHIPGGAGVTSNWVGDRLDLGISAMGQTVDASITVEWRDGRDDGHDGSGSTERRKQKKGSGKLETNGTSRKQRTTGKGSGGE